MSHVLGHVTLIRHHNTSCHLCKWVKLKSDCSHNQWLLCIFNSPFKHLTSCKSKLNLYLCPRPKSVYTVAWSVFYRSKNRRRGTDNVVLKRARPSAQGAQLSNCVAATVRRPAIWRLCRSEVLRERACASIELQASCRADGCSLVQMRNCLSFLCITHFANLAQKQNVHAALWFCPLANHHTGGVYEAHLQNEILLLMDETMNDRPNNLILFFYIWNKTIYWWFRNA